jgi:ankyrin repeat protein
LTVDLDYQGPFGNTLLHVAAAAGDVREVKRLLAAGADPRIANREGRTPLEVARMARKPRVCAVLSAADSPTAKGPGVD